MEEPEKQDLYHFSSVVSILEEMADSILNPLYKRKNLKIFFEKKYSCHGKDCFILLFKNKNLFHYENSRKNLL